MSFTHEQLRQLGYVLGKDGSYSRTETCSPRVSHAKPKPTPRKTLQNNNEEKAGGEKRFVLRITRYATRLLDEDNLAGSKLLTDQLRYAGIIPSDAPDKLKIINDQVKVAHKAQERTEVEIKQL